MRPMTMRNAKTIPHGYTVRRLMGDWFFKKGRRFSAAYETYEAARVAAWNDLFQTVNQKVKDIGKQTT